MKTWGDLLKIDPTLAKVDDELRRSKGRIDRGADRWREYECAKLFVSRHVGRVAKEGTNETLRSPLAYEIAMRHVTDSLEI